MSRCRVKDRTKQPPITGCPVCGGIGTIDVGMRADNDCPACYPTGDPFGTQRAKAANR